MKRLGITGHVRKQKYPQSQGGEHNRFSNILNRQFNADSPMEKIVTDVIGRFKDVLRIDFQYSKCDDLREVIDKAIHYFNCEKPIRKLNRKPPVQYRIEQAA